MAKLRPRLLNLARNPKAARAAALRRIVPNSPTYGFPWVKLADGSITFRERGFVAAPSPSLLLARHNYELARIHRELRDVHARRGLEIGCGFGRLSMAFAEHSQAHIAIDINEEALAAARTSYPGIDFRPAGALALPFPDCHFDLLVTWTVIQHIRPQQIGTAASEIRRVLAPGGTLLICEETRDPDGSGGHTWHRSVQTYERILSPLRLVRHGLIDEIAAVPGMESPGEIMVFVADPSGTPTD
jgi:SAM-dependent methyltransferase